MKLEKKIFIERFYSNVKYSIDRKDLQMRTIQYA